MQKPALDTTKLVLGEVVSTMSVYKPPFAKLCLLNLCLLLNACAQVAWTKKKVEKLVATSITLYLVNSSLSCQNDALCMRNNRRKASSEYTRI